MFETGQTQVDYNLIQEKNDALTYLKETDWYVVRNKETGKEIPAEVTNKRTAARLLL